MSEETSHSYNYINQLLNTHFGVSDDKIAPFLKDYNLILWDDRISTIGLDTLTPDREVKILITQSDGSAEEISTYHTLSNEQIDWFKSGSALNFLSKKD